MHPSIGMAKTKQIAEGEQSAESQGGGSSNLHRWELVAIVFVLAALAIYHVVTLTVQSYFIDEVAEILIAKDEIWSSIFMTDSMPPLYTLVLRGWLILVPNADNARWLSVLCGMGTVLLVWGISRKLTGALPSLLTAALFAFSPLQMFYSQLIRGYCWFTLVAVLCVGMFLLAVQFRLKRYWVGFVIAGVIGAYTHYYFAFVPMSLLLAWVWRRDWGQWRAVLLSCVSMGVLALPVLIFLGSDFSYQHDLRKPRPLSLAAAGYTYFSYFSGYALGPSQRELQLLTGREAAIQALPWLVIVGVSLCVLAVAGARSCKSRGIFEYIVCLTLVPLGLLWLVSAFSGITYNVRHLCWITFPMSVWLGNAVGDGGGKWLKRSVAVAVLCCFGTFGFANYQRVYVADYQTEDTRQTSLFIARNDELATPIFVVSDYVAGAMQYYSPDRADRIFELPKPGVRSVEIRGAQMVEQSVEEIRSRTQDYFWIVYSRGFHGDPEGLFLDRIRQCGIEPVAEFAGVVIYRGQITQLTLP